MSDGDGTYPARRRLTIRFSRTPPRAQYLAQFVKPRAAMYRPQRHEFAEGMTILVSIEVNRRLPRSRQIIGGKRIVAARQHRLQHPLQPVRGCFRISQLADVLLRRLAHSLAQAVV